MAFLVQNNTETNELSQKHSSTTYQSAGGSGTNATMLEIAPSGL